MEYWIPVTIAAAFFQNLRFMLQKHLKDSRLSTSGASFTRFLYGAPIAAALVAVLHLGLGWPLPRAGPGFALYVVIGGMAQILATNCVVALFAERNFAIGIGFKKTETIQTAMLSLLILGEAISVHGLAAIMLGVAGVLLMSNSSTRKGGVAGEAGRHWFLNRATGYGIGAGFLFGVSAVCYRGATLALDGSNAFFTAAVTLALVTAIQVVAMLFYLHFRERDQIIKVLQSWRVSGLVGVTGILGSLGWFTAFALQNAAYVKALGQIELLFTFIGSYLVFGERSTAREILGILLVVASIILLVLL